MGRQRRVSRWGATLLVGLLLDACHTEGKSRDAEAPLGSLEGSVKLSGETLPQPTVVRNTTDPEVCGQEQTLDDMVVSPTNRGIRYVLLGLADVPRESIPSFPPGHLTIDNADCRFTPHAAVLTVGSTVEAVNKDPLLHTTHLYGPLEADLSLPIQGARRSRIVERPGIIVVKCDIHGWMQAFIRVDPHPFHAVSDPKGTFQISGIPAGKYELEAWHEKLGAQSAPVVIRPGQTAHVEIKYALGEQ